VPSVKIASDISEPLRDFGRLVDGMIPALIALIPSIYWEVRALVQITDSLPFGSLPAFPSTWGMLSCSGSQVIEDTAKSVGKTVCYGDQQHMLKSKKCAKKKPNALCYGLHAGQSNKWRTRRVLIAWPSAGTNSAVTGKRQIPMQRDTNAGDVGQIVVFRRFPRSKSSL
jgi:hypothetical protein